MDGHHDGRPRTAGSQDDVRFISTAMTTNFENNNQAKQHSDRVSKSREVYETFMKGIFEFHKKRNTPMTEPPYIDGKPVNLYITYGYVLKVRLYFKHRYAPKV